MIVNILGRREIRVLPPPVLTPAMACVNTFWHCQHLPKNFYISYISAITQIGDTALINAAQEGETDIVIELLKAKPDLNMQNEVCEISCIAMGYGVIYSVKLSHSMETLH